MTRATRGFCTGCGAVLVLSLVGGCAQSGQNNRQTTQQPAAATPVQAAANAAGSVVNAATGAVNGAVSGAVNGAATGGGAKPVKKRPRIKSNGRGGYDASELQKAALKNAHAVRDRYGVIDRTKKPTTRPTTQPANR